MVMNTDTFILSTENLAPCGLRVCKNGARSVSTLEIIMCDLPDFSFLFVLCYSVFVLLVNIFFLLYHVY